MEIVLPARMTYRAWSGIPPQVKKGAVALAKNPGKHFRHLLHIQQPRQLGYSRDPFLLPIIWSHCFSRILEDPDS